MTATLISLWSVGVFSGVAVWLARQTETPAASLVERYCMAIWLMSSVGFFVAWILWGVLMGEGFGVGQ